MKQVIIILSILFFAAISNAQVGGVRIGKDSKEANSKAMLEVASDSKGILIPRLSTTQREEIFPDGKNTTAVSLLVYDLNLNKFMYWTGDTWEAIGGEKGQTLAELLKSSSSAEGNKITGLGEPGDETDAATKKYVDDNLATTPSGETTPADGKVGDTFFNITERKFYIHDGTAWKALGLESNSITASMLKGSGGALSAGTNGFVLQSNGDGTFSWLDISSGLPVDPSSLSLGDGQFYVGNSGKAKATPKTSIPLSGFGVAQSDIDLGSKKITNLAVPIDGSDAATKKYVDDNSSAVGVINTLTSIDASSALSANQGKVLKELNDKKLDKTISFGGDVTGTFDNLVLGKISGTKLDQMGATNGQVLQWNGTSWIASTVTSGGDADADPTNELQDLSKVLIKGNDAGGKTITGLAVPTSASDAATKKYVDDLATSTSGGTAPATGKSGDTFYNTTEEKFYVHDGSGWKPVGKQTLAEVLINNASAGNNKITDLTDPTNAQDAATKSYVDSKAGGVTDLSYTVANDKGTVVSSTGVNADLPVVDATNAGLMIPADKKKLNNITDCTVADKDKILSVDGAGKAVWIANAGGGSSLALYKKKDNYGTESKYRASGANAANVKIVQTKGSDPYETTVTIPAGVWMETLWLVHDLDDTSKNWNVTIVFEGKEYNNSFADAILPDVSVLSQIAGGVDLLRGYDRVLIQHLNNVGNGELHYDIGSLDTYSGLIYYIFHW